ncbi:hypothetical protein CIHG_09983 [Coccidioides immitis H538.4]|uniref:Uncharacterized protein n=1 Tax=Coccidioides immitis H538.4 TaxID=396776 RepID=A0A0J8UWJ6_COCIT|nr:hypothetical protein CIHG_09983 [Coccidioides immitis H538.4]
MSENALLDRYINSLDDTRQDSDDISALAKYSAQIAADQIQLLEEGSDYLQLGMPWQQNLAFTAKSFALVTFINCIILDEDSADIDLLLSWLETTIFNPDQMASEELATISFKSLVVLSRISRLNAPNLTRSLLQFIVQNRQSGALAEEAHLYTRHLITGTQRPNDSFISLTLDSEGDSSITYKNVIHTIITVATISKDSKIVALAQSMLLQKIGRVNVVLDACIVEETVALALKSEPTDFQLLLKFYARLYRDAVIQGNALIVDAVHRSRKYLALYLQKDNPLFKIYLTSLLESIVNKGGATDREKGRSNEVDLSAKEIYPYLRPVASLLSKLGSLEDIPGGLHENGDILSLLRDTWFNIAAHDVSLTSEAGHVYHEDLRILAEHSPPLVSDNRAELLESDIELNTVLRRGMNASHSSDKKKSLVQELPALEQEIKRLSYPKLIFLNATLLLESLRASSGDFTKILTYFLDPALNSPDIVNCMRAVVDKIVTLYLERFVSSNSAKFSAPYISQQLADTFVACCHRIQSIQQVASAAAAKIISKYPSSLCEKKSLFTLLDLLTLLWSSCLDEELDEYEWKSSFVSTTGKLGPG